MRIEKDWKALIGNACWSWILAWVPLAIKAIDVALTSFAFDGQTLSYTHGVITRSTENVDLRRVRQISAEDNPFTGGKLLLTQTDGLTKTVPYVKHPSKIAEQLRHTVDEFSRSRGEVTNRIIN